MVASTRLDERPRHIWRVDVCDEDGAPRLSGAASGLSLQLDHGVEVSVDPLISDGVLAVTLQLPEGGNAAGTRLFADLTGVSVARAVAEEPPVGTVTPIDVTTGAARWRAVRRLVVVEHLAGRVGASCDRSPSLWVAEAAWAAINCSTELHDYATRRAKQAGPALLLIDVGSLLGEDRRLVPASATLLGPVRDLTADPRLARFDELRPSM